MDTRIGWYQPEQQGQAKDLWVRMWLTEQGTPNNNMNENDNNNCSIDNPDYIPLNGESNRTSKTDSPVSDYNYYNPAKRKRENRASTFGLNENCNELIGVFGGCPWRRHTPYGLGTIGYDYVISFIRLKC